MLGIYSDLWKNQFLVLLIFCIWGVIYFFIDFCFHFDFSVESLSLRAKSVMDFTWGYLSEIRSHGREESETSLVRQRNLTVMEPGKCQTTQWRAGWVFRLLAMPCICQKCLNFRLRLLPVTGYELPEKVALAKEVLYNWGNTWRSWEPESICW